MNLSDFTDKLLAYLHIEQDLCQNEIARQKTMSRQEKIDNSLLLPDASIIDGDDSVYVLHVPDNNSKLRAGDKVIIRPNGSNATNNTKAVVLDNLLDTITVETSSSLDISSAYELEICSFDLIQSLIGCLEGISSGKTGAGFLRVLAQEESVMSEDLFKINPTEISSFRIVLDRLNSEQREAVSGMLEFPSVHVLQGPPGTGKTKVLAATAIAASLSKREVVIIANTHHAVNNALQKIYEMDSSIPLFKIGELLKAEELTDDIHKFPRFKDYNDFARANIKKKRKGHVVGMTIWGAITSLGLRDHSHFRPYLALVDEASQMPLSYASILGKCAMSVCLFGDSRQMPPIFRPELSNNPLSVSILDYCTETVMAPTVALTTTYRMNAEITGWVSRRYYEPHGIHLISAPNSCNRTIGSIPSVDLYRISGNILSSAKSIELVDSMELPGAEHCTESNRIEAAYVAELVAMAMTAGIPVNQMAVITPFRRQVAAIRDAVRSKFNELSMIGCDLPMVDTVERLQGQDVELIIISMACTDEHYLSEMRDFLLNPNRLNVMVSRARTKVVVIAHKSLLELF